MQYGNYGFVELRLNFKDFRLKEKSGYGSEA